VPVQINVDYDGAASLFLLPCVRFSVLMSACRVWCVQFLLLGQRKKFKTCAGRLTLSMVLPNGIFGNVWVLCRAFVFSVPAKLLWQTSVPDCPERPSPGMPFRLLQQRGNRRH
jgi:hypothetical protein